MNTRLPDRDAVFIADVEVTLATPCGDDSEESLKRLVEEDTFQAIESRHAVSFGNLFGGVDAVLLEEAIDVESVEDEAQCPVCHERNRK